MYIHTLVISKHSQHHILTWLSLAKSKWRCPHSFPALHLSSRNLWIRGSILAVVASTLPFFPPECCWFWSSHPVISFDSYMIKEKRKKRRNLLMLARRIMIIEVRDLMGGHILRTCRLISSILSMLRAINFGSTSRRQLIHDDAVPTRQTTELLLQWGQAKASNRWPGLTIIIFSVLDDEKDEVTLLLLLQQHKVQLHENK